MGPAATGPGVVGPGGIDVEVHRPGGVDLRATLGVVRRGRGDPTWHDDPDGTLWKAWRTPEGPVTVRLRQRRRDERSASEQGTPPTPMGRLGRRASRPGSVLATLWGAGSDWLASRLPRMLGDGDDPSGFVVHHPLVADAARCFASWRVPCTGLVLESLVPAIIEQRVTGTEAFGAYRRLVRRYGEPAPGPLDGRPLHVAPSAAGWAAVPSWDWSRAGVDAQRADTVMRAVRVAGRLEEGAELPPDVARRRMRSVPGVGGWTVAEVAHVALGDADAVSFGDYHVARDIGYALTGLETDDEGLAVLLEPYAGHRYRVQRLLELAGARRPRRGPRRSLPTHGPRW